MSDIGDKVIPELIEALDMTQYFQQGSLLKVSPSLIPIAA